MFSRVDSGSLKSSDSMFLPVFENVSAQFRILKAWIPELTIMYKSCEIWNPDYFTLRDHYILLRQCFSVVHS